MTPSRGPRAATSLVCLALLLLAVPMSGLVRGVQPIAQSEPRPDPQDPPADPAPDRAQTTAPAPPNGQAAPGVETPDLPDGPEPSAPIPPPDTASPAAPSPAAPSPAAPSPAAPSPGTSAPDAAGTSGAPRASGLARRRRDQAPPEMAVATPADRTALVARRMEALRQEADALVSEGRTLMAELRRLEIERDTRAEELRAADAAVLEAEQAEQASAERLLRLEQTRVEQTPDLEARLVDLYKRGTRSRLRLLVDARTVQDLGRAARAVASLTALGERRLEAHARLLEALRTERESLARNRADSQARRIAALAARDDARRAVARRVARAAEIDARRDLNAQLAGELQVAQERLEERLAALSAGGAPGPLPTIPLAPFRGALPWPASGRVTARFGSPSAVPGAGPRTGIELGAPEGAPARAVHEGTVRFAAPFAGYGTLVIVDHGGNQFTLYGYLGATAVVTGENVVTGQPIGVVGLGPDGTPMLHFEIRVDGRSVDPLQWLDSRQVAAGP